jgi:hypothetical protein
LNTIRNKVKKIEKRFNNDDTQKRDAISINKKADN